MPATNLQHQIGDAIQHLHRARRVNAPLKPMPRIGAEIETARTPCNRLGPPEGRLDIDVLGSVAHRRGVAPHDAGQRLHLFLVGNDAHFAVQRHGIAVEQLELFARLAPAHMQLRTGNLVAIKNVGGLAQLKHHVVGNIDQYRYAALAATRQTIHHPSGGLHMGVHAADHPTAKAPAKIGRFDHNFYRIRRSHGNLHFRQSLQWRPRQCRQFTRNAIHTQRMRQIGRELERKKHIVQIQISTNVLSQRRVSGQFQQPTVVFRQTQFPRRAQHAVAFYATQLAHLDFERLAIFTRRQFGANQCTGHLDAHARIGRAANDLQQFATARIDLAYAQAIGIRVLHGLFDFGHHNAAKSRRRRVKLFHLQPCHGERIGQLLRGKRRITKFAQPGFRKLHSVSLIQSLLKSVKAQIHQRNWLKKRTSPSKNRRKSFTP